jgi:hypothetical protein
VVLRCENKGEKVSDANVKGDGCLSKRKGVGILMLSMSWMRREALHAVDEVL